MLKFRYLILLLPVLLIGCNQSTKKQSPLVENADWRYFGQGSPGKIAKLFSPDIISTSHHERDFTVSPNGNELFYSLVLPGYSLSTIIYLYHDGAFWSHPHVAPFSGSYNDLEPSFSPDGKKVFFISKRPLDANDKTDDWNIWFVERVQNGWSDPVPVGPNINTEEDEYYPSITIEGHLYFTAVRDSSYGKEDIYFSKFENGTFSESKNVGPSINTGSNEFNAFVAPDESYLIFSSIGRKDGFGGGDLYISYRINDSTWGEAKNMGDKINSDKIDYCPFVTSDGKYLFFTSQRVDPEIQASRVKNYEKVVQLMNGIENGTGNIYWVNFDSE
ncbi:MAG: hypothetical protein R2750_08315 [Bacteroidales bacterium]